MRVPRMTFPKIFKPNTIRPLTRWVVEWPIGSGCGMIGRRSNLRLRSLVPLERLARWRPKHGTAEMLQLGKVIIIILTCVQPTWHAKTLMGGVGVAIDLVREYGFLMIIM